MEKKHLAIVIALLALGFGIYILLNPPRKNSIVPNTIVKHDTIYLKLNDTAKPSNLTSVCVECEEETVGQPMNHFKNVLENYRKNVWDSINNNVIFSAPTKGLTFTDMSNRTSSTTNYDKTDARSIWFSLETIKQFICTIEKNNAKLFHPATDLGIRFYYAVYENDYSDVSKRNKHTLFMVPTFKNDNGAEVDFDPRETYLRQTKLNERYQGYYIKNMANYAELLKNAGSAPGLMLAEKEPSIAQKSTNIIPQGKVAATTTDATMIKNNGQLCPVNCPTINTLSSIDN
jgi:hypothetical protein